VHAACILLFAALLPSGCNRREAAGWQGYLEAELVYVAAPLGGRLEQLAVSKGARIEQGAPLFTLERESEAAALREASERLRAAEARLADSRKGARPPELAALEARLDQAQAAAELSKRELARQQELFTTRVIAEHDFDRARLTHERNLRGVDELEAQIATARLGARSDAIVAAEADLAAAAAARERAAWAVAEKAQSAPSGALVFDTLFREGEFVPAGTPVVALLPPAHLKVRFFVPEADFAALTAGDRVRVAVAGRPPIDATVSYLSPRPEYTPPVLYNRDNRTKLVFMIEADIDAGAASHLHPGQPVDVTRAGPGTEGFR
jgi:HlyD family secretion protein